MPKYRENEGARNVTARKIKPVKARMLRIQEYTSQESWKTGTERSRTRERASRVEVFVFSVRDINILDKRN